MRIARPFVWFVCALALGCGGDDDPSPGDADDAAVSGWRELPSVGNGPIQEIGVAELGGKIYVVGGFSATTVVADVQVYDPVAMSWSSAADLPRAVHHVNLAAYSGKLYVLGSLQSYLFTAIGTTWEYDPAGNAWTEKVPMPAGTQRGAGVAAVIDNKICVAGGFRNGSAVAEFSCYDPAGNSWGPLLAPLPAPNDHLVGAAIDNVLYAIAGRSGGITALRSEVHAYDASGDSWVRKADIPTPRGGMAAGVVNGKVYVVGGEGNSAVASGVFPQVEEYDPTTDTWRSLDNMRTPRHGMGAAGLDGVLYVPGGATVQAFGAVATFEALTP